MSSKKPLSRTVKNFFGIGDFGFSMMANVETFLFVFFLTNVAKFSLPMVALIGTIVSITDIFVAPFYGAIISGTKAFKWGRNRSWLILTPPLVVIFYMFAFTKIGPEPIAAFIVCAGAILAHTFWNLAWVANVSLVSIMGSTPEDRALLASRRGAWTALAGVFFSYVGMPLALYMGNVLNNPVLGFTLEAGLMALIMMIGYRVHFKLSEGSELTGAQLKEAADAGAPKSDQVPVRIMLKSVFQNPPLLVLLLADLTRYMLNFIMAAAAAYYFTYVAQDMALFPIYLLVTSIAALIGAYATGYLCKVFSTRLVSIVGLVAVGVLLIVSKYVAFNLTLFFVAVVAARLFFGVLTSSLVAMYSDVVTYGEWKTGKSATSVIMGSMVMPLKIALLSRGTVIPIALGAAGFVAGANPATASLALKDAVNNVFLLIPGILALVGALILTVGYRLSREKLAHYQIEIDKRKAKAA